MSAAWNDWNQRLGRQGKPPALWLRELLLELDPLLRGGTSTEDRDDTAAWLLESPLFGQTDQEGRLACDGLGDWERDLMEELRKAGDRLACSPSEQLSLLMREFAQWLSLPGFDPIGARIGEDAQRIRWLKDLTAQGCEVYRMERESKITSPKDWVPRVASSRGSDWPSAPGVTLPIFFVIVCKEGKPHGVNGWLRLWLWPCEGARLELLPSVPQRVQPLAQSWVQGLENASQWMRQQMRGQGGAWKDHALVWEVHTNEAAHDLLMGNSASAAFAVAGLWLARQWAPPRWAGLLCSMRHDDWQAARITAAILPSAAGAETGADLGPVGGMPVKDLASWVLGQGSAGRERPLRVAKGQTFELSAPGQSMPLIDPHASAFELLKTLAREALNLSEAQSRLMGVLHAQLPHFAPPDAGDASPWHIPSLDTQWQGNPDDPAWGKMVKAAYQGQPPAESLEAFALKRWALRADEQSEGGSGSVLCLFVNLSVNEEHRPARATQTPANPARPQGYSLEQLLAGYESDPEHPLQQVQALQIVGAPGGGKTWLLARFEQACAERLLWQLDRRSRESEVIEVSEVSDAADARDLFPYLDVPLYVSLSPLPLDFLTDEKIVAWFREQVLGQDAPDSRLKQRLQSPRSEPGIRLRICLDGLNELKVPPGQTREQRARDVVRALWNELQPGLPMLLGTRTHHRYTLDFTSANGEAFHVAVASLNPWEPAQIRGYLEKRWAGNAHAHLRSRVDEILQKIENPAPAGQRLREVLSLPLYLRVQCELFEAGATQLFDSRARLLAALLWRNVYREFVDKAEEGGGRDDTGLFTDQERAIASDFKENPDQISPAFPREGRLLQGLFALAWSMWLANPNEPVASRGKVALALGPVKPSPNLPKADPVSVRGCLRGLGWPKRQSEKWIGQWIHMAKELGWLTVDEKSQTARFAHQAYGEFLASQQLFWKERHAALAKNPLPANWSAQELADLARQLAPPALERSCLEELDRQHGELASLWARVPTDLLDEWMENGLALPSAVVRGAMNSNGWNDGEIQRERDNLKVEGESVLTEQGGDWVWSLRRYGDFVKKRGVFARCNPAPWATQPLAWGLMARYTGLWSPYRDQMRQTLEQRLGGDMARELYSEVGRLPEAPPGALDEIVLLALEALPDPLPWLQALLNAARRTTPARDERLAAERQTGCWALLSRALLQEGPKLDGIHKSNPALVAWRREAAGLLLAVNQSADPELGPHSAGLADGDGEGGVGGLRAHDLRHRLQAGLCLGAQGALGSDAGDHLRYERVAVSGGLSGLNTQSGAETQGVRLRREHWCEIRPREKGLAPFGMARYPVTVGEFRAFVDAGGYQDADAPWWLQGQAPERSGARNWLQEALCDGRRSPEQGPGNWSDQRWMTSLQPKVCISWFEAAAYAHWAASALYADALANKAQSLGVTALTLRLPTEREWRAALQGVGEEAWPGHGSSGDPSPLLFNHLATGWGRTSPVGSFPGSRTPSGLMDSAGNQWEWCSNNPYADQHAYCAASLANDREPRALRGGSCSSAATRCRVGCRIGVVPVNATKDLSGVRLVLAVAL